MANTSSIAEDGVMELRPWQQLAELTEQIDAATAHVGGLLARAAAAIDGLPSDPQPPSVEVDGARDLSSAVARLRHRVTALQALSTGVVQAKKVHHWDAERTARKWLARHAGLSFRDATELTRITTAFARFPTFRQALIDGHITP